MAKGNDLAIAYVQLLPSFDKFFAKAASDLNAKSAEFKKYGAQAGTQWAQGFASTAKATTTTTGATSTGGGASGASAVGTAAAAGLGAEVGGELGTAEAAAMGAGVAVADNYAKGLASRSAVVSAAGTALTTGVTLPLGAAVLLSAKAAMDFESAFAGVRKTVDASEAEFAVLSQAIRDMANEVPVAREEIAKIVELGGQFGLPNEDLLGFAKTVSELGVATNLTTEDAALMLAQFAAVTGLPTDEFDRLGATIANLGNNMATQEDRIVQFMLRLGGQGRIIGLTADEIAGFSAALASVGIMPEAGGTAFSRVFQRISDAVQTSNEDLSEFAQIAGLTTKEFKDLYAANPADLIEQFVSGLGEIAKTGSTSPLLEELSLIDVRIRDALQRLAGTDILAKALDIANKGWEENIALVEEAQKRYGTAESKFAIFRNQLSDVGVELGNAILPAVTDLLEAAGPLVDVIGGLATAFGKLPQPIQTALLGITGLAIAAGPVAAVLGRVGTAVSTVLASSSASSLSGAATGVAQLGGASGAAATLMSKYGVSANTAAKASQGLSVAAKGAGLAFGTFLVSQLVFDQLNEGSGVLQRFTDEMNRLKATAAGSVDAEIDLSSLVAAEQDTMRFQNLWQEFGSEVEFVGTGVKADVEQVQRAFDALAATDPDAAARGLDDLERRTAGLDRNSRQYKINTEFIERNRESLGLMAIASASAADQQEQTTDVIGGTGDSYANAADGATRLASQMTRLDVASKLNVGSFEAAAQAAQAYLNAVERASSVDNLLESSLTAGQNIRGLYEGGGFKESETERQAKARKIATEQDRIATEMLKSATSTEAFTDAVNRLNPELAILEVNSQAAAAAGNAFRKSVEDSSYIDNVIESTVSLGGAYKTARKSIKGLPADLDLAAVSLGKLRPRQQRAVEGVLALGGATADYLGTLIESGRSTGEVVGEANRLRDAYVAQFRQLGFNEQQIRKYLEAMGLTPEQVNTAIKVSGIEESRAKLEAYASLLEGKIPGSVAASVIASVESGDFEGAAQQLARFAATNPIDIPLGVTVDQGSITTAQDALDEIERITMALPQDIDVTRASLGQYSEDEVRGLQAIQSAAGSAQQVIADFVEAGDWAGAAKQAQTYQGEFRKILENFGVVDEAAQNYYLSLLGLDDVTVNNAIELAGVEEALAKLNIYKSVLDKLDSFTLEDQFKIADLLAAGDYEGAQKLIDEEVSQGRELLFPTAVDTTQATEDIRVWKMTVNGDPILVSAEAETDKGTKIFAEWRTDESGKAVFVPADAQTDPADRTIGQWRLDENGKKVLVPTWADVTEAKAIEDEFRRNLEDPSNPAYLPVDADDEPARGKAWILATDIGKLAPIFTIGVDDTAARVKLAAFQRDFPIFGVSSPDFRLPTGIGGVDGDTDTPFADGGYVSGPGTGTSDSISARLSNGEYVMTAAATRSLGVDFLDKLNKGYVPGFAMGGLVGDTPLPAINAGGTKVDYTVVEAKSRPTAEDLVRVTNSAVFLGASV